MSEPLTPRSRSRAEEAVAALSSCDGLYVRMSCNRWWLCLLAVLSMVDASFVITFTLDRNIANGFSLVIVLIATALLVDTTLCKTRVFVADHRTTLFGLPLQACGWWNTVWYSPYRYDLTLELLVWWIFAPPLARQLADILDVACFLRCYVFFAYWGCTHFAQRPACRALAKLARLKLSMRFVVAATFLEWPLWSGVCVTACFFTLVSFMFARLEERSLFDSFYFVWVTTGTIGFGDVYPHTYGGKFVSVLCGTFAWFSISFTIGVLTEKVQSNRVISRNWMLMLCAFLALLNRRNLAVAVVVAAFRYNSARRRTSCVSRCTMQMRSSTLTHAASAFSCARRNASSLRAKMNAAFEASAQVRTLTVFSAQVQAQFQEAFLSHGTHWGATDAPVAEHHYMHSNWNGPPDAVLSLERKLDHLSYLLSRLAS